MKPLIIFRRANGEVERRGNVFDGVPSVGHHIEYSDGVFEVTHVVWSRHWDDRVPFVIAEERLAHVIPERP